MVRRYRFLLRTAPGDALETAHHEAIASLDESDRATILATAQEQLVAGQRLTTSDLPQIAHLVTLGEQR